MGFMKNLFSKDKKQKKSLQEENPSSLTSEEEENIQSEYELAKDKASSAADYCDQILETSRQLEELKVEYQAVTSYLTDMQKIERIPEEEREELNDAARKIITLTRERAKYQNKTRKITDIQYKNIAKYEDIMPFEVSKMIKNESYNITIKNDMRYLEGEKGSLQYQKEESIQNQTYLRNISIVTCVSVLLLFVVFLVIQSMFEVNTQIPFLLTIVMALVAVVYIFVNEKKNRSNLHLVERKFNRAITLLNKVKIKYINNTNELDYSYQKYMVNSSAELNYLWEQYLKAKEEEKHYTKNSEELEYYNKELIKLLRRHEISDPDIWIYQAVAIIDSKEMVEVRHRLNVRRQKLRERIDYNNSFKQKSIDMVNKYINRSPENKEEIMELVRKYRIEL